MMRHLQSQKFVVYLLGLIALLGVIVAGGPPAAIEHLSWGVAAAMSVLIAGRSLQNAIRNRYTPQPAQPPPPVPSVAPAPPPLPRAPFDGTRFEPPADPFLPPDPNTHKHWGR
jgi:hypothetical protein